MFQPYPAHLAGGTLGVVGTKLVYWWMRAQETWDESH
jgi:hypothetical protein